MAEIDLTKLFNYLNATQTLIGAAKDASHLLGLALNNKSGGNVTVEVEVCERTRRALLDGIEGIESLKRLDPQK